MRLRRAVLLLVTASLVSLAGCTVPEETQPDPLLRACPQWIEGDWRHQAPFSFDAATPGAVDVVAPSENGTLLLEQGGFPLDRYRLRFQDVQITGGDLEVRVFANGTDQQRGIQDYRDPERPMSVPVLSLGPGTDVDDREFDVFLAPLAHDGGTSPDALRINWRFSSWNGTAGSASGTLTVTAAYRVCGAILP